jgi:hypothetical protein
MPFDTLQVARWGSAWGSLGALAASDGSGSHAYLQRLARNDEPLRDLSDAVHFLGILHGRHPGVIDFAQGHARLGIERDWLEAAATAFAVERAFIAQIIAAAGPLPSTPGHAESEAATAAQRHALDMLAQSDRAGCATGAAIALALDWAVIRDTLDAAAKRLNLVPPRVELPVAEETVTVVDTLLREPALERAMLFGAQQLFAQHRGLWNLLETRASARGRH